MGAKKNADGVSIGEIEDLIHNFLIIMLEHSMRQKDGWKARFFLYCTSYSVTYLQFGNLPFSVNMFELVLSLPNTILT
jgi:hypothetical protein